MKKAMFLEVDDGWYGLYVDGKLVEASTNRSINHILDLLGDAGLLASRVEVEWASDELDYQITESGIFPETYE